MSSDVFTKENLDIYLKELAKEFRKLNGKTMPAEIILVGGAAILTNYGFRNMTTDIDAVISASSAMKEAINHVGDKYQLPNGWINKDFMRTSSYSPKIIQFSVFYKTFSNILNVRTVNAEYLIAMKLRSGRKYKNDLSDIIGILSEHKKVGKPIELEAIDLAVKNLYGGWEGFPEESKSFIENAIKNGNFEKLYESVKTDELQAKDVLVNFNKSYPNIANDTNANDIINTLKARKRRL